MPEKLRIKAVQQQMDQNFSSLSEYLRHLIRKDQEKKQISTKGDELQNR